MAIVNSTFRAYTEKLGATDTSTFVGNEGDLFYDPNTATLRISDGSTPGGVPVAGGGGGGGISLTDISASSTSPGTAALSYDNITGVFTYTPPDLSSYAQTSNLNIANWDTAYGWGNHADAGYLTSLGPAAGVTTAKINNWDTAYGWGNHADAGYLTSVALNDVTDVNITAPSNGQVLKYDGAEWVNETASSGGGEANFVATGTIPNGSPIIIREDGTVEAVALAPSGGFSAGSPQTIRNFTTSYIAATYDSNNNKVVIAYAAGTNTGQGVAIVGTVSGNSITYGTPVTFTATNIDQISAVFDTSNDKVVIAYRDASTNSRAIVGTVSGDSISFGTPVTFAGNCAYISCAYDSTNNNIVIAYKDGDNSSFGTAIVGSVSGNSISFGIPVVFNSARTDYISTLYDPNNDKVVVAYKDFGGSNKQGTAIVGTISGTSISFGTRVQFTNNFSEYISAVYDSTNDKVVIAYEDVDNSSHGTAIVGTISGTSISFGSPVVFASSTTEYISIAYDPTNQTIAIAYEDLDNSSDGTTILGSVSGSSIRFNTAIVFDSDAVKFTATTYDSTNNKIVTAYGDTTSGKAVVINADNTDPTNLTNENYIGIAAESVSDGATGKINIVSGINRSQTGLTTARTYYVQVDGTIALTPDTPSVVAGTSISSTEIVVKG